MALVRSAKRYLVCVKFCSFTLHSNDMVQAFCLRLSADLFFFAGFGLRLGIFAVGFAL